MIEILTIGHELLDGRVVNSNESLISSFLLEKGLRVNRSLTIPDDLSLIKQCITESLTRASVLIVTGGLGPTEDDITRQAIAGAAGVDLILDQDALNDIKSFFSKKDKAMPESNIKQAYLPNGATLLSNHQGTAPSFSTIIRNTLLIALPGPPNELMPILKTNALPQMMRFLGIIEASSIQETLRTFGIGESLLQDKLTPVYPLPEGVELSFQASPAEVLIHLLSKKENQLAFDSLRTKIVSIVGKDIYHTGKETYIDLLVQKLITEKKTIGFAESCTGGLVSKLLSDISGVSDCFKGSVVSYSNDVKISQLGVNKDTISSNGAVSEQCALEMAIGVRRTLKTSMGASITGIAGPNGGTNEKPVGTVYIAISSEKKNWVKPFQFYGNRERIRFLAAKHCLYNCLKF